MNEIAVKICVVCHTKKSIDSFHNLKREWKQCNIKRALKRYFKKNHILQKRIDKYALFKDLNERLKILQENLSVNNYINKSYLENNQISINVIYSKPHKKNFTTKRTDAYQIDDIWSSDVLDLKNGGPKNYRDF